MKSLILLKYFKTRIDSSRSERGEREEKYREMGMETEREREREKERE